MARDVDVAKQVARTQKDLNQEDLRQKESLANANPAGPTRKASPAGADSAQPSDAPSEIATSPRSAKKRRNSSWLWPLGVAATSIAGVAVLVLRGCWHRHMSWPVRAQGSSYQVCIGCGIKRLFDEKRFCSYGPYRYDLNELIAWEKSHRPPATPPQVQRPAS